MWQKESPLKLAGWQHLVAGFLAGCFCTMAFLLVVPQHTSGRAGYEPPSRLRPPNFVLQPLQQQQQQPEQQRATQGEPPFGPTGGDPAPLPWPPLLSAEQLQRGTAFYGTGRRMERLAARLMAGEPITAATIGGSVTRGGGASSEAATFPGRLFSFINATWPHSDHVLVNRAIGATNAGTFATCTDRLVPQQADLVVLEFTANEAADLPFSSPARRAFETLLRRLLRLPRAPAVLVLHYYAWWQAPGDGAPGGLFYRPAEAQLGTLAQYYDVPSPSLRNAVYPRMQADAAPFKHSAVLQCCLSSLAGDPLAQAEEGRKDEYFYYDATHPADQGHQALAELTAHVLRTAARNVNAAGGPGAVLRASGAAERLQQDVPPPMIPGNADAATTVCAMQEDFKGVAVAMEGFEFAPERPDKPTFVEQKWGYRASRLGAWVELEVSTETPGGDDRAVVVLSYLRSYTGMGLATVECVKGCECHTSGMDGFWTTRNSLAQMHSFKARWNATQHPRCRMRVTVVERPAEGKGGVTGSSAALEEGMSFGHKFQLSAIMVSQSVLALGGYAGQADDLLEGATKPSPFVGHGG